MFSRDFNEIFHKYATDKEIFHELMPLRTREILLVAPAFDAFTLEQDGLLTEILFDGYYQLNMSNPPRVTNVSTVDEALERCASRHFDIIIVMSRLGQGGHVELSRALRQAAPRIPIYLLLNDNVEVGVMDRRRQELQRHFDQIFVWNGNPEIFMAMVKFMEDRANVLNDTKVGLTRVILLVEDSIRYYSRYLPILYSEILKQTTRLAKDQNMDRMTRTLSMRVRPKVILATSYEEAMAFCDQFQDCLLCVISDRKFPKDGTLDREAGIKLIRALKERIPDLPTLLQSSDPLKESWATALGSGFLNKNSYTLGAELSAFFYERLGFGDFVFRDPQGEEIARATDMEDLRDKLRTVPAESLVYHAMRNHFSSWIMARGEVQVAKVLARFRISDYRDPEEMRTFLIDVGDYVQRMKTLGKVIPLTDSTPRDEPNILRLASGSMGGKGRGVAYTHSMLSRMDLESLVPEANIRIPRSAIIGTEEFTGFIHRNGLRQMVQDDPDDDAIKRRFLMGSLSPELTAKLRLFLTKHAKVPLAVRSSGLLEDSLSHPFAGLYNTFFLPNNDPDPAVREVQLVEAIKLVYASVYSKASRAYFQAIDYKIEEEQMAILVQEVSGRRFGSRFYPHISGVAQSFNYYPVAYTQPQDGIANIAVGLGKYVVEGEKAYRFAPPYPEMDMLPPKEQLRTTQKRFYALDMSRTSVDLYSGEDATLLNLDIQEAEKDGALQHCASVWDWNDDRIQDGLDHLGPRIVNFRNILKYDQFPLARILQRLLELIREAMETPVEIEFAVNLDPDPQNGKPTFTLLQIKHQLMESGDVNLSPEDLDPAEVFLFSERCVGNGTVEGLRDIVWVDPEGFDKFETPALAAELEKLNDRFRLEGGKYVLLGPGRWGSNDRHLGIPIVWSMISCAQVIVEYAMENFQADASLGSHFFHNVTSLNIGYFTVPYPRGSSLLDWDWLRRQPEAWRSGCLVHTRLEEPVHIVMDGRRSASAIFKRAPAPLPEEPEEFQ
ncbi:PEP/pyruvate-binding domain-containing protein [Geothrix edaphica]|uniref:Phosphoenolpyruvate synthase n=1 Tax=Geothrix edaphica TaxID=2927976 RepID=A0ABQ5PZI2_9BACT|nr:PEP/pyruvate-binding domain-containing protein [Geothrix edaphica]GLH67530.1 phosphoenolpyruvate synthase [Geothrix edaphica]